jgi:predicted transcriptional regulator
MIGEPSQNSDQKATTLPDDSGDGLSASAKRAREKWGLAIDGGFQIVPDLLLRHQGDLKLSTTDIVVLLNLMMSWWIVGQAPFPRANTIAKRMGASERTVQRSLNRLRTLRLIARAKVTTDKSEERQAYDLTPLAQRLSKIAEGDFVTQRRRRHRVEGVGVHTPSFG